MKSFLFCKFIYSFSCYIFYIAIIILQEWETEEEDEEMDEEEDGEEDGEMDREEDREGDEEDTIGEK